MVSSSAVTTKVTTGSPYQLDQNQVSRASSALLRHIKTQQVDKEKTATKKTLIGDNDDDSDAEDIPLNNEAVWLVLTTKKHVVDKNRLKPGKITIPHSLNASPSLSVCLITADPQRAVKNIVADESFPQHLTSRIDKVIGFSKLKSRYQSFESRRQLFSEHDVFLADDRIIMRLVKTLGKIFYKSSKRPIPVRIAEIEKVDGKKVKKDPKQRSKPNAEDSAFASPAIVAKEIEKALNSAAVQLAPATTAAIRVGSSNFTPQQLSENVEAVVKGLTDKFITKGWKNIKALHVKGANTMAMPIWLASELWVEEGDVVEKTADDDKAIEGAKNDKKRKQIEAGEGEKISEGGKKSKKPKAVDDDEAASLSARKEKLQKQKAKALQDGEESGRKAAATPAKAEAGSTKKKRKSTS
ncbi:ribosomal protein L1 [Aspergillus campestris IBT 28561]|uniref:Ribosomal protein L1 n=1 Tax=Aspergillus campestris (strain IBT 28561) TaxID=1392248 RepID=A0A2I1D588_ASPC2|nr:ribosomal protein L1 [Aspergillus campestris IBT 28561]PKY05023.1 ribosomal protein L1 [Aspergillus campestris IBT 28561]